MTGKRVLIVDDNTTNRLILTAHALSWEMLPTAVGSGQEALAVLSSGQEFDLALLDMRMPGMDGSMLAGQIRRLPSFSALPLVLLSSVGQHPLANTPFSAVLAKPIKPAQLYEILCGIFANRGRADTDQPRQRGKGDKAERGLIRRWPVRTRCAFC